MINKGRATLLRGVRLNLEAGHRITRILQVLAILRSTYYDYWKWKSSQSAQKRHQMMQQVLNCWLKHPMYGYPRIAKYFKKTLNLSISRYLVYRFMRGLGIQSRMIKKMKELKSYTEIAQRPNLIKKSIDKSSVLLTDITYIPVKKKWVYLASLYNPETRRVEAHKVGRNITKELATRVIQPTILKALGTKIVHSDMGSQYTNDLFERTLNRCEVKHSYSRKGCSGDNARIESFHSILKREYVNFQSFQSIEEAIVGIDLYIQWYNNERISLVA